MNDTQLATMDIQLYHYTSRQGYEGILRDQKIKSTPSYSFYAHFGQGVYLTAMGPSAGRSFILRNNRITTNRSDVIAKTTHFISFPPGSLKNVKKIVCGRSVFLHPEDIDLTTVAYSTGQVLQE